MSQANHEGSSITGGTLFTEVFGETGIAGLVQSCSITARTNSENILAINYKGVAAVSKRAGSVDLTVDAILTSPSGVGRDMYAYENTLDPITIITSDGTQARAKQAILSGVYVTGINYSFAVQDNSTTSWTYICDRVDWAVDQDAVTPIDGTGQNFSPVQFDQIVAQYDGTTASGIQTATYAGTIDRDEVYQLGQTTPIDRPITFPFDVTVTIETLAEDSQRISDFVTDFDWRTYEGGNGIIVQVIGGTCEGGTTATTNACIASGLKPVDGTLNVAVGDNSTTSATFNSWNFYF